MFNNTTEIVSYISFICSSLASDPYSRFGVLLPHSTKILTLEDIDKKIKKTKKHIEYLSNQLHFNSRGGKVFRANKVSILQQISLSSRLKLLEQAKAIVLDPLVITKPSVPVQRGQPIMFKTAQDVALFANKYFYQIVDEGIQSYPIFDGEHSKLLERIIESLIRKKILEGYGGVFEFP